MIPFHSQDKYEEVWFQLSLNIDILDGSIPWNNDQETKESRNYGVPHQVEEPTSRICSVEKKVIHTKESTTNKALGKMLVSRGGAC